MRIPFEDQHLGIANAPFQSIRETNRGHRSRRPIEFADEQRARRRALSESSCAAVEIDLKTLEIDLKKGQFLSEALKDP